MILSAAPATSRHSIKHILLCGSLYGRVYLDALYKTRHLRLAAILARGSRTSTLLAEQAGVASITYLDQLATTPDAAIVAVGSEAGFHLAQACLKRRIPVLLEHPVLPSHCSDLLALAQAMDVRLHINSHFSLLPPAQEFIQLCRALNSQAQPLSVQISCNSRTLFSLLDIAQAIFGLFNFEALCSDALDAEEHYYQMRFKLNKIPCIVHYQNWRSAQDDSLDSPLGHQCTITYPQGIMQLNSSFGPCLWFPLMAATTGVAYPAYSSLSRLDQAPTHADIIAWREDANIQAIESLITPDEDQFTQTPVYLTHLCQNWHTLFTAHGFKVAPPQVNKLTDIFFTAKQLVCSAKR